MKEHLKPIIKEGNSIGIYIAYSVLGLVSFIFFGTLSIKPKPSK